MQPVDTPTRYGLSISETALLTNFLEALLIAVLSFTAVVLLFMALLCWTEWLDTKRKTKLLNDPSALPTRASQANIESSRAVLKVSDGASQS